MRCHSDDYPEKIENLHVFLQSRTKSNVFIKPQNAPFNGGTRGQIF